MAKQKNTNSSASSNAADRESIGLVLGFEMVTITRSPFAVAPMIVEVGLLLIATIEDFIWQKQIDLIRF